MYDFRPELFHELSVSQSLMTRQCVLWNA